jgi:hypothetical protein
MEYKFKLPIGDWSGDGHGKADWFTISSSHPLQEVREAYIKATEKVGFSLEGDGEKVPCGEYQEWTFPAERLTEMGLGEDPYYKERIEDAYNTDYPDYLGKVDDVSSDFFAQMVIDFIMVHNPEIKLEITNEGLEMFQWYGFDKKNRHLGYFGYGLFE